MKQNCDTLRDLVLFVQFKKREKHLCGVLPLVRLQASPCYFTKSNVPPWVFFTFFKIVQMVPIRAKHRKFFAVRDLF